MRLDSVRPIFVCVSLFILLPGICRAQANPPSATIEAPDDSTTFAYPIAPDRGAAAVRDSLRKLKTRASFVMITAHPDDEDGGLLAYESRYTGADTTLLTLNRGEGGQNAMSSNYWDELGLVRTQELLAADRYYGVHQYWTRVADFGFSKTLEESLAEWGHDRVLYDVVRVIRMTRPLVVSAVFIGSVSDGHGQHQVSGVMAQEAYKAAGDPNVFPDQIRAGLRPWSPLKVYARVPFARVTSQGIYDYATGHWSPVRFRNYVDGSWIEGTPKANAEVPDGLYDGFYGLSYFQVGRQGLNEQKSQNGGVGLPLPGPVRTSYHLYASRVSDHASGKAENFYDGVDISLEGIASYAPAAQRTEWKKRLAELSATVEKAWNAFSPEDPAKIAPLLADGLAQTNSLLDDLSKSTLPVDACYNMTHELKVKQRQFNDALIAALGLNVLATVAPSDDRRPNEIQPSFQIAVPGQKFNVNIHLANQGSEPVEVKKIGLDTSGNAVWNVAATQSAPAPSTGTLGSGEARTLVLSVTASDHAQLTRPYFSRPTVEQPYYDIDDPRYLNLSTAPYPLTAQSTIEYHNVEIHMASAVQAVRRVTGPGLVLDPLLVGPPISLWLSPTAGVVPLTSTALHLSVTLHSNVKGPAKGSIHLTLPEGWSSTPATVDFSTAKDGEEQNLAFEIHPNGVRVQPYTIKAVAEYNGQEIAAGYRMVGYSGLRPYPYYRNATYRTTGVDLRIPAGLRVGYIMGTGDDVPSSLEDLGLHVNFLSAQDVETGDLSDYDAILVGIRAYAVRPEIRTFNGRLLDYVKNGGVLLVQYQTPEFDHDYGPYAFSLGDNPEKVVQENSPVTFGHPDDPIFAWPNKITAADFSGWIEERGHDFIEKWDPKYIAPTEVHDQDQEPQKGGLLYARYGQGLYVYTAYAFYRQLPEGVPGAFRIFSNLLSLKRNPAFAPGK